MLTDIFSKGIITISALIIASLLLSIKLSFEQSFRIVFGIFFILFLPGFVWSFVFFKIYSLDSLERIVISVALSVSTIPLIIFLINKFSNIKINPVNTLIEITVFILIGILLTGAKKYFKNQTDEA